jgi:hypothetical protein
MKCHVSDGLDVSRSYSFSVAEIFEIAKMQNNSAFGMSYLLCYLQNNSVSLLFMFENVQREYKRARQRRQKKTIT